VKHLKDVIVAGVAATIVLGITTQINQGWAAGSHSGGHGHDEELSFGKPGDSQNVDRTLVIEMFDNRYEPENISVKAGETIKFVVKNSGELVHEFNIGTSQMHAEHQAEMLEMLYAGVLEADRVNHHMMKTGGGHGMDHDDSNSVLLEPGKSGEIIWEFAKATEIEFACNVPGHYEDGMRGQVRYQ
jgi:uncharacterized cupredoxin-like copper-binding protein